MFQQAFFKRWEAEGPNIWGLERVVIVDPAKSVNPSSDYSAIVCLGFDRVNNALYVLGGVNERLFPEETYEQAIQLAAKYSTYRIAVEVNSLNEYITNPLNNYLALKGFPPCEQIKVKGNKRDRISQLVPLYRTGCVYHAPGDPISTVLEQVFYNFFTKS